MAIPPTPILRPCPAVWQNIVGNVKIGPVFCQQFSFVKEVVQALHLKKNVFSFPHSAVLLRKKE